MNNKLLVYAIVALVAGYFLYEPIMDRFFTDTSLRVSEAPALPLTDQQQDIHLSTSRMKLSFSPYGGRITSVQLLQYTTDNNEPTQLISPLLKTRSGIRVEIPLLDENLDDRYYDSKIDQQEIRFTQQTKQGLEVRKSYHTMSGYGVVLDLTFTNRSSKPIVFPQGYRITPFYGMDTKDPKKLKIAWQNLDDPDIQRETGKKFRKRTVLEKPIEWIGLQDQYFSQVFIPKNQDYQISLSPLGDWQPYADLSSPPLTLEPGQSHQNSYRLYLGPLDKKELKMIHAGLEGIIDYGTFEFLGKGVLFLLQSIHRYITNYGICLMVMAVLFRLLLFPLAQYNLRSLREMPRISEEIYRLEEENTEDPDELEKSLKILRKKQFRSMVGSFLPLLIQVPIFLALYQVLNSSLDLRQADFALWITDLSLRDPYFVLPFFMGLAMVAQQRLTSIDPKTDKTWLWMPAIFTLIFAFFPAGLVLFWLIDTALAALQLSGIVLKEKQIAV